MHRLKNSILFFLALAACFFSSCANAPVGEAAVKQTGYKIQEEEKKALLEQTFDSLLSAIRNEVPTKQLLDFITDSSEYWLDTLERAVFSEREEELNARPFCEVYAILLYRLFEREHLFQSTEDRMLSLVLAKRGILERLTDFQLGPMEVKNDRGSVGLASSPKVPVILFTWDDRHWELDLIASIPLVTKGIESIAVKKNWTTTKLAIYLLEKEYRFQYTFVDASLLEPIPGI